MKIATVSILVVACITLSACSQHAGRQLLGSAVANAADTEVRYEPAACRTLAQQCVQGEYQEWQTSDKHMGCSCKKL